MNNPFVDNYAREVRYLRLSVTDRCNLTCMYCHTNGSYIPHTHIMRYEEMETFIALAVKRGVDKVRLTGGEPFVRKGFTNFIEKIRKDFPNLDLRITTNGTLIEPYVQMLKDNNIKINFSLDTLDKNLFMKITGKDNFDIVRKNLDRLIDANIVLKINAVAMRGLNNHELPAFLKLAKENILDMRYIEFMPMGSDTVWNTSLYWSAEDIVRQAQEFENLILLERSSSHTEGPARLYSIENGKGRFGVITPLSSHFCAACNRLRITSDGKLRTCLFDDNEYRLLPLLRNKKITSLQLEKVIELATKQKQIGAELLAKRKNAVANRKMISIGG